MLLLRGFQENKRFRFTVFYFKSIPPAILLDINDPYLAIFIYIK